MIPGRVFYVNRDDVNIAATGAGVSTPQDFIVVSAPSTMCLLILGGWITQATRYGDTLAEAMRVTLNRYASVGSGGSSITPTKQQVGEASATFTARGGDTTLGSTATLLQSHAFHIQQGWFYEPTESDMIVVPPSGVFAFTLPEDLPSAAAIDVSGCMAVMEIG